MKKVLLSFDIEEFDMPFEYGQTISFEKQIEVSAQGTKTILDILKRHKIKATFFSTVVFARNTPELIARIVNEGHELASHGYFHSSFKSEDLPTSKKELERISASAISGFRMARMKPVDDNAIKAAGYSYNSSLNPVYLPGRYNNFFKPRTVFKKGGLVQLPASAVPVVRFPLFWLSFHNLPLWLYKRLCAITIISDGYLNIYFHPWEFVDLHDASYNFPEFVKRNSGEFMISRFENWISWLKSQHYVFTTIQQHLSTEQKQC